MAYALVGTIGSAIQGASGASVTPAWGTGENRTANNLLIAWLAIDGSTSVPTTPTGWSLFGNPGSGTSVKAGIYYKLAAGGDTAPTFSAVTGAVLTAQLAEFSGNLTTIVFDQGGGTAGTTSPLVGSTGVADSQLGDLVVVASALLYSAAATKTFTDTGNNNVVFTSTNSAATSTANHYDFCYGFQNGNASADQDSLSFTTTKITGVALAIASFKPAATVIPSPILNFAYSSN